MDRIRYRIYTENKDDEKGIMAIVDRCFKASTTTYGHGRWEGKPERSMIIEVIDSIAMKDTVLDVALQIKTYLEQDAVLVTYESTTATLV